MLRCFTITLLSNKSVVFDFLYMTDFSLYFYTYFCMTNIEIDIQQCTNKLLKVKNSRQPVQMCIFLKQLEYNNDFISCFTFNRG